MNVQELPAEQEITRLRRQLAVRTLERDRAIVAAEALRDEMDEATSALDTYVGDLVRVEYDPNDDGGDVIKVLIVPRGTADDVTVLEISTAEAREVVAGIVAVLR